MTDPIDDPTQLKSEPGKKEFDKVDRALEVQVIDWLQWSDFEPREAHLSALALMMISKRKAAFDAQAMRIQELEGEIKRLNDKYDFQLLVKRDEEQKAKLEKAKVFLRHLSKRVEAAVDIGGNPIIRRPIAAIEAEDLLKELEGE